MTAPTRLPGALLVLLACALVGHLWMQGAPVDDGTAPAQHGAVQAHQTDTAAPAEGAHRMVVGCLAVLAAVAVLRPSVSISARHAAALRPVAAPAVPFRRRPRRLPRSTRAPVDQGVLLRV